MKHRYAVGMASLLVIAAVGAGAQEDRLVDPTGWLQRCRASVSRDAEMRREMYARIAAARGHRGKVVSQTHHGRWQSERYNRSAQPWFAQLEDRRDDGTVTGRLTVIGSGLLSKGRIRGKSDGRTVTGVVTDDGGAQLATFAGSVSPSGAMSGSYTTSDGDVGSWGVDGENH